MDESAEGKKKTPPVLASGNVLKPTTAPWSGPQTVRSDPFRHPEKMQAAQMTAERLTKKAEGRITFAFYDLIGFEMPDIAHFERAMYGAIEDLTEEDLDLAYELRLVVRAKMNEGHPVIQIGQYHGTVFKADSVEPEIVVDVQGRVANDIREAMRRIQAD